MTTGDSSDSPVPSAGPSDNPTSADAPSRRSVSDEVIAGGVAWARQAVREQFPEARALANDPSFERTMANACARVLDAEAFRSAAEVVVDEILTSLPPTTGSDRDALVHGLAVFFALGGCGASPYVDLVADGLQT